VGGRSSRMGRDKARLPYRGEALAEWIARAVKTAAGSATLVGNAPLGGIPDLYPGEGPLGGILTALRHTSADWNLIVACDMPEVSAEFLDTLLDAAELFGASSGAGALLPRGPSGQVEPLCAVYHKRAGAAMERRFADGIRKVTAALEEVATIWYPVAELKTFQNVNTPEDWAGYAAR